MNSKKFSFLCYFLYKRINKNLWTITKRDINIFSLNLSLSFLWPSSGESNVKIEQKHILTPTILETADYIFDKGKYEECYNFLINSKDIEHIEVKWRLCRTLYNMAKEDKYDKKYKQSLISQAYNIIHNELNNHYNNYAVHKWYAIILDAKSSNEGLKEKILQITTVKKHMDLAVQLNPSDASLLHMLGEICYQATEIPWHQRVTIEIMATSVPTYTYEEALEYYLKAEAVQPRFYSVNLLRIGCCYLRINKQDQAKYYLELAASYPVKSNIDHQAKKEAAELMKKLK